MLATAVSAANDCFFCMDSHGAFASALLEREHAVHLEPVIDGSRPARRRASIPKMAALLHIARTVQHAPLRLTRADVAAAHDAGASEGDVQLAVLIASGFSMYNRLVDGFRARTAAEHRGVPGARRRDRRQRIQRGAGQRRRTSNHFLTTARLSHG